MSIYIPIWCYFKDNQNCLGSNDTICFQPFYCNFEPSFLMFVPPFCQKSTFWISSFLICLCCFIFVFRKLLKELQHIFEMKMDDPNRAAEIRKWSAIYGRFDSKRKAEKPLTLHEVCIPEQSNRHLVYFVPKKQTAYAVLDLFIFS